jgi:tetratricopeptide (TPR) repeat protein
LLKKNGVYLKLLKVKERKFYLPLHLILLTLVSFVLFSNNYRHEYLLDSGHTILENSKVRSLKYIPQYFIDPGTFSTLRDHADYRPILQTTYALNYWISGYDTWSWHLLQIVLHLISVLGLYFFSRKILFFFRPHEDESFKLHVPLAAALLFAVHPYTSGVVNYLSARSSLLVAAFLLPSLAIYMKPKDSAGYAKVPWISFVLYALALFTKVEAVGALAVYWLYEIVPSGCEREKATPSSGRNKNFSLGFLADLAHSFNRTTLQRLWPFLAATGVYFLIRSYLVEGFLAEARHAADVTPSVYFYTQLTVWWHYVLRWFAPVNLIADDLTYPIFRSFWNPKVLLAASGWLIVIMVLKGTYQKQPQYTFLAIASLALISPTSSIAPLAEMVNEHRPYLPLAVLSLTWIIPLSIFVAKHSNSGLLFRGMAFSGLVLVLISLSALTWKRNLVYQTSESYWTDVLQKAPSSRAHVNYGLTQMQKGLYTKALEHFNRALELAPNWHIIHTNLGIVYKALGENEKALHHFSRAVEMEQYTSVALIYRGEYYLSRKNYTLAMTDFENAIPKSREFYRIYKGLATSNAGQGAWQESVEYTTKCLQIDAARAEQDIVAISTPFWEDENLYQAGINYYKALTQILPERWWLYYNIGSLAQRLGDFELAEEAMARSAELKNSDL